MTVPVLNSDLLTVPGKYCPSQTAYSRFQTREVNIGDVPLGAHHPIRIQSMTTTNTMDTQGTVEQSVRMIEAGCEYVRITAPSQKEARNLEKIKKELRSRGYRTPLIADIHYTPNAAEIAAQIVEKVRINPGNYADKKRFEALDYSDLEYAAELMRIRDKFAPLVKICKTYGTAMRIGTNHGSLSDRIMNRFGDTPLGMVESALEFARICADLDYHDIVFSMKASNPQVMVQAYRLLVHKMVAEGMQYPIHLGVTEAGDGEDGRIKSAVGIGALLEDGIGDTVRVSLTEPPEAEIPVARTLVNRYATRSNHDPIPEIGRNPINPFAYRRRATQEVAGLGGNNVPVVILSLSGPVIPQTLSAIGYGYEPTPDKWAIADMVADFIYLGNQDLDFELPGTLKKLVDHTCWQSLKASDNTFPLFPIDQYQTASRRSERLNFVSARLSDLTPSTLEALDAIPNTVLVLHTQNAHAMPELRRAFIELFTRKIRLPVVIQRPYRAHSPDELMLFSATDLGGLLTDGLGDGIWIEANPPDLATATRTAFGILQATRTRISKTEYISCPSCGRTLFDLQETTARIRKCTDHLKGVKIGIMGCIVNGPGEMADADYGYVGSGPGTITLYKGKEIVKRNVPTAVAVDELIDLIKDDGNWVDP